MEDKPLSPKWFIQAMAILAIAGMTLPLVAGVAGFLKNEIMRPAAIERTTYEGSLVINCSIFPFPSLG